MYTHPSHQQADPPGPCDHQDSSEWSPRLQRRVQRVCAGLVPHPTALGRILVFLIRNPAL